MMQKWKKKNQRNIIMRIYLETTEIIGGIKLKKRILITLILALLILGIATTVNASEQTAFITSTEITSNNNAYSNETLGENRISFL